VAVTKLEWSCRNISNIWCVCDEKREESAKARELLLILLNENFSEDNTKANVKRNLEYAVLLVWKFIILQQSIIKVIQDRNDRIPNEFGTFVTKKWGELPQKKENISLCKTNNFGKINKNFWSKIVNNL